MAKDPWYKFYPEVWESDTKLQSCSLEAQGFLIKMMNMMHQSCKPGYLLINGAIPPMTTLCSLSRLHHKTVYKNLKELLGKGVLVEEDGVLCCKRMVKDHAFRESQRAFGKKGGNPAITESTVKGSVKTPLKPRSKSIEYRVKKKETTKERIVVPDKFTTDAKRVLAYLNASIGAKYQPAKGTLEPIIARLKEGFSVEDCIQVVTGQLLDPYFIDNPKFLRPSTLFGNKMAGYLQASKKNDRRKSGSDHVCGAPFDAPSQRRPR